MNSRIGDSKSITQRPHTVECVPGCIGRLPFRIEAKDWLQHKQNRKES
jgi:hypothetical protein